MRQGYRKIAEGKDRGKVCALSSDSVIKGSTRTVPMLPKWNEGV